MEASADPPPPEASSEMESDATDDGILPIKPTPYIVLCMIDGGMPEYLRSFKSPSQLQKGLLDCMQTFLVLEYMEILQLVMKVLRNYT